MRLAGVPRAAGHRGAAAPRSQPPQNSSSRAPSLSTAWVRMGMAAFGFFSQVAFTTDRRTRRTRRTCGNRPLSGTRSQPTPRSTAICTRSSRAVCSSSGSGGDVGPSGGGGSSSGDPPVPPGSATAAMDPGDGDTPGNSPNIRFCQCVLAAALASQLPLAIRFLFILFPTLRHATPISRRRTVRIPTLSDQCRAQLAQLFPSPSDDSLVPPTTKRDCRIEKLVQQTYSVLVDELDHTEELQSRTPPRLRVTVDHAQLTYAKYSILWPEEREVIDFVIGIDYLPAQAPFLLAHELGHSVAQHVHTLLGAHARWERATACFRFDSIARLLTGKEPAVQGEISRVPQVQGSLAAVYTSIQRRHNEFEADHIGAILFARAGFTPVTYVQTMAWVGARNKDTTSFLYRTHPTTRRRLQKMVTIRPAMMDCHRPTRQIRELCKELAKDVE